ncbi:ABC transporter substrate-binding protein [Pantoea alhagi]|uniref:ABC transporter substrate-binding protein n=1 Tax=Pantoea alhagi TaxID=1891675 RepID=A0A1W6B1F2_9GAMM|nr:DUF2076 domain-containing protein [Pantoea alhagi]ARJ40907.1 ABC transporter substrate-binding protein [Pantoea alhagi]
MQSEEQRLIESLFSRLKQAESQSAPRDAAAERLIEQQLRQQPAAPYYMAQAILIQEAAMKKLSAQVTELENQLTQAQQQLSQAQQQPARQSSGGFLSSLFGGGQRQATPQQPVWNNAPQQPYAQQPYNNAPQQQPYAQQPYGTARGGSGFLGGALQTAVGVAGGVVMADMLTSMFHHSQPEEIVNIINEPALPDPQPLDTSLDTFNNVDDRAFLQDASWQQDDNAGFDSNDFGNDDFNDDDSFI